MFCQFKVMFMCYLWGAVINTRCAPSALTLLNSQTAGPHQLHGCFSMADLCVNSQVRKLSAQLGLQHWHQLCYSERESFPQRANTTLVSFSERHLMTCPVSSWDKAWGWDRDIKMQRTNRCHCGGSQEMKNNVELWMSDLLDILLAFVMDLGSSTNSIVIVMR